MRLRQRVSAETAERINQHTRARQYDERPNLIQQTRPSKPQRVSVETGGRANTTNAQNRSSRACGYASGYQLKQLKSGLAASAVTPAGIS